jgi:chromosome segregation ATPase
MSTADDFTVFRKVAGDKIAELTERSERAERELAAANKEIDRLNRYVDTFRSDEQLMGELAAKDAEIARLRRQRDTLWKPMAHKNDEERDALRDELAAANDALRQASSDALHMRDGFLQELAAAKAEIAELRAEAFLKAIGKWEASP